MHQASWKIAKKTRQFVWIPHSFFIFFISNVLFVRAFNSCCSIQFFFPLEIAIFIQYFFFISHKSFQISLDSEAKWKKKNEYEHTQKIKLYITFLYFNRAVSAVLVFFRFPCIQCNLLRRITTWNKSLSDWKELSYLQYIGLKRDIDLFVEYYKEKKPPF